MNILKELLLIILLSMVLSVILLMSWVWIRVEKRDREISDDKDDLAGGPW